MSPAGNARELVMAWGWNATAYQILNPGILHWFSADARAVVGYVQQGRYLLAAGSPVCAEEELPSTVLAFEAFAKQQGSTACFVLAEDRLRTITEPWPDHCSIAIGAQPAWNPSEWEAITRAHASLRAQFHRARNKGVVVRQVSASAVAEHAELRRILLDWLQTRGLPPMHFLVEPDILTHEMEHRLIFAAEREGKTVAFLIASPIPLRNGYLLELLARSPRAPNGASELLIDAAMRTLALAGATYVTMGLVALSTHAEQAMASNPWWFRWMVLIARAHANHFYNFRGLERFRVKMTPSRWENSYVIANESRFSPFALYAMGGAFSGISPILAIALGVLKAAREEVRRHTNL